MHTSLIILAGGVSSRMKKQISFEGLTKEEIIQANKRSKGLIGIGPEGRPFLDYLLYNAKRAGYINIYIIISEQGKLFKEFYGKKDRNNDFHGLKISFAVQSIPKNRTKPFGTADALFQTIEQYPELKNKYYTVCNSDNLYSFEALFALRKVKNENAFISYDRDAFLFSSKKISSFAVVELNEQNTLLNIIEKPQYKEIKNYRDNLGKLRVSMNAFKFHGSLFYEFLKNCPIHPERKEKELPTALLNMLKKHPNKTTGIPFSEHVPDLTAKDDIVIVKRYLKEHYPKLDWDFA